MTANARPPRPANIMMRRDFSPGIRFDEAAIENSANVAAGPSLWMPRDIRCPGVMGRSRAVHHSAAEATAEAPTRRRRPRHEQDD